MAELLLRLNRVHYPVTALGPGRRLGIWVQGCSIGCRGCISLDTWDHDAVAGIPVDEAVEQVTGQVGDDLPDGITVSGGEPFEQAAAVAALLDGLRARFASAAPIDVLIFTGLTARQLVGHEDLVTRADAIVAGPYAASRASGEPLLASANQELLLLTDLARVRYTDLELGSPRTRVQVVASGGRLYLLGLPRPGEMERFVELLSSRGITLDEVSWR